MSELAIRVDDIVAEPYSAAPQLTARLQVTESTGTPVHAMALRAQVRIEPQRRAYDDAEADGLLDQFGGRERWVQTLKPFLWLQTSTVMQGFTGSAMVDLPLQVTYDFDVTASKYLHALEQGEAPLLFLFSGTVFTRGVSGFGVEQIGWHLEDSYRMPVSTWRECIQLHFPNTGWLRLSHEAMHELTAYRSRHGLTGWDEVFQRLMPGTREQVP